MSSFLDKVFNEKTGKYEERGMYDPTKRYGFKNISNETFTFTWDRNPITVQPGQEVELPEHLAILATHKLVDKVMQDEIHAEEKKVRAETKDPYWKNPKGISMAVPHARKIYEDKIIRLLKVDEQSPQIQILRAQAKEQILNDLSNGQKAPAPLEAVIGSIAQSGNPTAPAEFAEIPKR